VREGLIRNACRKACPLLGGLNVLYEKLSAFIHLKYQQSDKGLLLELCKKVIFNDPAQNCIIKGNRSNWDGLPPDKSLFHSSPAYGLPIGNLTSQVFANFYLNTFDRFVKHDLGIRFYGRYVDDFVIVHPDKEYLKTLIPTFLGIMKYYKTYKLRKLMLFKYLSGWWWNYVYLSGGIAKFVIKQNSI
jgi:hypothetical protein